jgi:hypothetical protein
MTSQEIRFEINWVYILPSVVIAAAGLGFIGWIVTAQVLRETMQGLPISGGWSWPLVIGLDLICLGAFLALIWSIHCDSRTQFLDSQLTQPGLFGLRVIRWSEVTGVKVFGGVGYHIHAPGKKIVIAPYAYAKPEAVIAELNRRISLAQKQ